MQARTLIESIPPAATEMRIVILTVLFSAVHGFLLPGLPLSRGPEDGQTLSSLIEFLEAYASQMLSTADSTYTSGDSQAIPLVPTTDSCDSSTTVNLSLVTEGAPTSAWTSNILYNSDLPGWVPPSTITHATSPESVREWPVPSTPAVSPSRPSPIVSAPTSTASPEQTSTITHPQNMPQDVPKSPSTSRHPVESAPHTTSSIPHTTGSASTQPTSKSTQPANLSLYRSLFGFASQSIVWHTTKTKTTSSHSKPRPTTITKPTASPPRPSPTTKSSFKSSKTSTKDRGPAVVTSVIKPDPRCPYPYPGIYCGKTKTTLITKAAKTKGKA
jgi:hypothetical protein